MGWDADRLAALRERYGAAGPGAFHDPAFADIAARVIRGGRRPAPYAGIPTLLSAPQAPGPEGLQVALYGMPMDNGVTNRPGARFGPRALRGIERIGPYEHVLRVAPIHQARVADIGDVAFSSRFRLEESHADIEAFVARIRDAGALPLGVGGDHSVTLPVLRALGRARPVGLIHIDAHCDTSGEFDHARFHHGAPFRQAVLEGVLDPTRTVQIGIRGGAEWLWEFSYESGMTVIHAEEIDSLGLPAVITRARQVVGAGPAYLSFDIDSLDPAFAPGTGTPEAGGLTVREALAILRGMKGVNLIGADLVEIAPHYDPSTATLLAGGQILFTILSLLVLSPALPPAGGGG
ncbi:MAG: agmatinase [Paracoccaceae bacterium]|nr:MAG: agmatinase [Paracoccaceae bacterium]